MNFTTHNDDPSLGPEGTSLRGTLTQDFSVLKEVFGEPNTYELEDKVQGCWTIRFDDGLVATIYSWKNYGVDLPEVRNWNIGGKDRGYEAIAYIRNAIFDFYKEKAA